MIPAKLVTGGSGFVAGHLIIQLLEAGETVHATVRDLRRADKLAPLVALQQRFPDKLRIFEADLLKPGSFDAAMQGCDVVHHVASPFKMPEQIRDGVKEMVEPALHGTENVLASVGRTPSVRRVVMTSTVGAIFGDYIDVINLMNGVCSEQYFNQTSMPQYNSYHYSKVVAEQRAWEIAGQQQHWDLVCINPGLVLGPTPSAASESGSLFLLDELFGGKLFFGVPDLGFTTVDVREVAFAHIAAANTASARGRYILAHEQMTLFIDLAQMVRPVHDRPSRLPGRQTPRWLVRLIGPLFGLSRVYVDNHVGIRFTCDNRRSIAELGVQYRPLAETMADHYASWRTAKAQKSGHR